MAGKGDNDHPTLLPGCLADKIKVQMEHSSQLFEHDRRNQVPGVELPFAFERKPYSCIKKNGEEISAPCGY